MGTCIDYSSTLDCFSYILLGAPDFPTNSNATLNSVFADIDGGVAAVAARTKNTEALKLLEECRAEIQANLQLYQDKKIFEGKKRIQQAKRIFTQAGKLKKTRHRSQSVSKRIIKSDAAQQGAQADQP